MRFVFAFIALLLTIPAQAAEWDSYVNSRYGYAVGIPPGFTGQGESESGDGQVFRSRDGSQTLTVWGGYLTGGDFTNEMAARKRSDTEAGWTISYEASSPQWISYSGTRSGLVLYARGIARCGDQYSMWRMVYSKQDVVRLDSVIEKLVQTFRAGGC